MVHLPFSGNFLPRCYEALTSGNAPVWLLLNSDLSTFFDNLTPKLFYEPQILVLSLRVELQNRSRSKSFIIIIIVL
jgi:hypothetical protein